MKTTAERKTTMKVEVDTEDGTLLFESGSVRLNLDGNIFGAYPDGNGTLRFILIETASGLKGTARQMDLRPWSSYMVGITAEQ